MRGDAQWRARGGLEHECRHRDDQSRSLALVARRTSLNMKGKLSADAASHCWRSRRIYTYCGVKK